MQGFNALLLRGFELLKHNILALKVHCLHEDCGVYRPALIHRHYLEYKLVIAQIGKAAFPCRLDAHTEFNRQPIVTVLHVLEEALLNGQALLFAHDGDLYGSGFRFEFPLNLQLHAYSLGKAVVYDLRFFP